MKPKFFSLASFFKLYKLYKLELEKLSIKASVFVDVIEVVDLAGDECKFFALYFGIFVADFFGFINILLFMSSFSFWISFKFIETLLLFSLLIFKFDVLLIDAKFVLLVMLSELFWFWSIIILLSIKLLL